MLSEEDRKAKIITWGNGEPCPICNKPFEKADTKHLFDEHWDEVKDILF